MPDVFSPPSHTPAPASPAPPALAVPVPWLTMAALAVHSAAAAAYGVVQYGGLTVPEPWMATTLELGSAITITAVYIVSGLLVLAWVSRASGIIRVKFPDRPKMSPTWQTLAWLIPGVNLFVPVMVLNDLWKAADPERGRYDVPGAGSIVAWLYWALTALPYLAVGAWTLVTSLQAGSFNLVLSIDPLGIAGIGAHALGSLVLAFFVFETNARINTLMPAPETPPAPGAPDDEHRYVTYD